MKLLRVHRRTAILGVTMYDLGIIMDALSYELGYSEPAPSTHPELEREFRADTDRLFRQVGKAIAAMDHVGEEHGD